MTATVAKIPDPLVVLRRAEREATGEEPGDLTHLADAVRTLIIGPLIAGGTPVVDDVQVKQLLADKQRLEKLLDEARKAPAVDTGEMERIRRALVLRTGELDQARAERDTARAQLRDQGPAPSGALELAQADNARLADELAAIQEQLSATRRSLELANRTLDEIADEQESAPAAVHVHHYPLAVPGQQPGPCACKHPYPRDPASFEAAEVVVPDVEPWSEVFGQLRGELDGRWPA